MKPYVTTHDDPAAPLKYALRDDAEIILATIPMLDLKTACSDFDRVLRLAPQKRHRIAHITLSLPAGAQLETRDWQRVVRHVLDSLGLETDRHPIVVTRHRGTNCDHVHVVASRVSWLGDVTTLDLDEVTSARIHVDLTTRLGLSEPEYPVLAPSPRLASRLPSRKKAPEVRALHDAVATVLARFRPQSSRDLDRHLAPTGFRIASRDVGGKSLPTFIRKDGTPFRRIDLKPDLTSYAVLARLAHVKALGNATRVISAYLLIKAIDRTALQHLKDLMNARNTYNSETASPRRDPAEPNRECDVSGAPAAPSPRPAGAGKSRRTVRRSWGSDRDPEIALHDDGRVSGDGARDKREDPVHGPGNSRDQGGAADPDRMTYGVWLRHLLAAVRSMGSRIHLSYSAIGTARIIFGDGVRAVLSGHQLKISAEAAGSSHVRTFTDALPIGFISSVAHVTKRPADPLSQRGMYHEKHSDPEIDPDGTATLDSYRQ
ncbi:MULTISPECIES: relaxase/mobilization nuclease domain-containing protein [unclassified Yoonia]|uniref:relaxase/mobilization nuclease domain-containing protein n=1 Tax=unclassified Yoonia TaxID=2629118 RepID=UPI002AFDCD9E|nr:MULTISPECIES: relaxase/mobilization nuclease domain-containing protein [unclassified Yoonia]